jgi:hypothetical protein
MGKVWTRAIFVGLAYLALASQAGAVSLTLQGSSAGLEQAQTQAVYASDATGSSQMIAGVGSPTPDEAKITEVGVPSMMPDGRVLFAAEVQPNNSNLKAHWAIYAGNPDAAPAKRIIPLISPRPVSSSCLPNFRGDSFPVADIDGNIAFISRQDHGPDGLFYFSRGNLICPVRVGDKTNEGHAIAVLGFGSQQMGEAGEIVFTAFLRIEQKPGPAVHRQAVLLASITRGISELAVEGTFGPNNTEYMRPFGLPAALSSPTGTIVAFTAKTPQGGALFEYSGSKMTRMMPTGIVTPLGPVTYLSPGRPGLMADGVAAVLGGCARTPAIFRMAHQHLDLQVSRGQITPFGTQLQSLGDPVLSANGSMYLGATDTDGDEKLYVLDRDDAFFEVDSPEMLFKIQFSEPRHRHSIFTGTLAVNQHGDFGYLGGL